MALAIVGVASGTASTPVDDTITVSLPAQSGTVTYNGAEQSPQWTNYDSAQLAMTGETAATNAGTYTVTFTPTGKCFWSNGTQDPVDVTWTINKAALNLSASISSKVVYNTTGTITLTNLGGGAITATSDNTSVLTVQSTTPTEVTVKCVAYSATKVTVTISAAESKNYLAGTTTCQVSTTKADGSITLSASGYTVTYGIPKVFHITENVSGGALSVTSSDTSVATATISGTTVTVNLVEYSETPVTITVNAHSTDNYRAATATYIVTPAKANGSVTLSANGGTVTYGTPKTFTVTENLSGGTLSVSSSDSSSVTATISGTTVTVTVLNHSSTNATITVTSAATNNYNAATATYIVTSEKLNSSVTLSANSGTVTYGTPKTFTVTGNASGGALSVSSSDSSVATATISGSTVTVNLVKYSTTSVTITVTSAATNNYNAASANYVVTPAKATSSITLSANSGTVTYGTPKVFTVTENVSGGALSVTSSDSSVATATISGSTVTVNLVKYSSTPVTITVNAHSTDNYRAASATYTATTARAATTISLDENSVTLTVAAPTATITVTTNSDGEISATPADDSVCTASVNGNVVTIEGEMNGNTTVAIAVAQTDRYNASSTKTVSVNVPIAIGQDMLEGRTLAQVQQIFQNGQGANYFKAGDYFDMTFPSEITLDEGNIAANSTWRVVCLGIDHNSSKEGTNRGHFCISKTTDGKEICFFGKQMNTSLTNVGGWNGCAMKTWLNGTFYNALPTDLKGVITACTKYTDNTGKMVNTSEVVTATSQKIWLMAEFEVRGSRKGANMYEENSQMQYDYYKNGNSQFRIRYNHASQDTAELWWTRSPYYDTSGRFCRFNADASSGYNGASDKRGFAPCFTIS